jgi:hypothetical protein
MVFTLPRKQPKRIQIPEEDKNRILSVLIYTLEHAPYRLGGEDRAFAEVMRGLLMDEKYRGMTRKQYQHLSEMLDQLERAYEEQEKSND